MRRRRMVLALGGAGVIAALVAVVGARGGGGMAAVLPDFDLSWHTVDGGGVMRSTGGDFELSGTIGQPDAGAMSGGNFTLTGGFWFEVLPSDCNADGVVNLFDYDTFQTCLNGPGGGPLPAGCNCYDFDGDGKITLFDFATMQDMFNGH
jgi:Dockerin type I domain